MSGEYLLVAIIIAVAATLFILPPIAAFLTSDPFSPVNDETREDDS